MSDRGYTAKGLELRAQAIQIEIEGMHSENKDRESRGENHKFLSQDFYIKAKEVLAISDQIINLSTKGTRVVQVQIPPRGCVSHKPVRVDVLGSEREIERFL